MFHSPCLRTWLNAAVLVLAVSGCPCLHATALAAGAAPLPAAPAKAMRMASANAAAQVDFPTLVERYGPAVVNISTAAPDQQASAQAPVPIDTDDPFTAFFKRSAPASSSDSQGSPPRAISGSGSGFIVSPNGVILTTAHVVDSADEVTVTLTDKRQFKGKVLAADVQSDVAVVKIDAARLPVVRLGDSSRLRVGEPVLTIGAPDGFDNTVTNGIVSATSYMMPDGANFPFYQTDVSVNPDNSGGPIFNRAGEVVGIHEQIYADTERYQSLTFAIPINLANKVRAQVQVQAQAQAQRKVSRGALGIDVQDVDPGLAGAFGLPQAAGALVTAIEPGTPAAASGLKPGDVVVQVGDQPIDRAADLADRLADPPPGGKTVLKLIRNRRPMTIMVGTGASAADDDLGPRQSDAGMGDRLGLTVHPMTPAELRANGLARGLIVDGVSGAAASAGIQPGDIILSLNGTPARSQRQVVALAARAGKEVALLIQRDNARSFVSLELR
ncbi:trypsin-like peptidase domain-containing protein [Trinickia mobilis]|uniref:trypsin-like peptidase domain-containing protein n=1 Tax=Trinickia mobilis TaxID=2816356 RepID=UPI002867BF9E|nr:trypsin-like peptidase domain-containing protein [Trinickia mobilis]